MRIIAMINQKGGVGKTTSVVNIGAGLAGLKQKVLLVDLDPQAHLTYSLGVKADELEVTVHELLKGDSAFEETLIEASSMKMIPASIDLASADGESLRFRFYSVRLPAQFGPAYFKRPDCR